MYFKLLKRNAGRSRKENGIYYTSLIISIVAFYIILSLENQDVFRFLKTMESQAVDKLLLLIPLLYLLSLVLIFLLVYFATNYQLERRNHEFGLYLMMGMRRSRLFFLLLLEDLSGSVLALLAGIPLAILLSEGISLITARVVGLGIIGHRFIISTGAILWTVAGFVAVKVAAHVVLSGRLIVREPLVLLRGSGEEKQKTVSKRKIRIHLVEGGLLLLSAYGMALTGISWSGPAGMGLTILLGVAGTFRLFAGAALLLGKRAERARKGLSAFTFRQLQENVCLRSGSMAAASLLMILSFCCLGYGSSVAWSSMEREEHVLDFTFTGEEKQVRKTLEQPGLRDKIDAVFELRAGLFFAESMPEDGEGGHTFDASGLEEAVAGLQESEERETILNNLGYFTSPYLISESGYNEILRLKGEAPISLGEREAALYRNADFAGETQNQALLAALKKEPVLWMDGTAYALKQQLYTDNIVTDRSIRIDLGVIVTDEVFEELLGGEHISSFWNVTLKKEYVQQEGMMQAVAQVNEQLKDCPLEHESYLQNIGRNLFYVAAASYTTIYLAVIFFIIGNTVLAVQFLMQQKKTGRRYRTLAVLGAQETAICRSASVQIRWYFGIPVVGAVISGLIGAVSMCRSLLPDSLSGSSGKLLLFVVVVLAATGVVECFYMRAVKRANYRYIREMMRTLPGE